MIMLWPALAWSLVLLSASWISSVKATALTYQLGASEKACFFADVDKRDVDPKVAFYFAVGFPFLSRAYGFVISELGIEPRFSSFYRFNLAVPSTSTSQ